MSMSERADPGRADLGRADGGGRAAARQESVVETARPIASTGDPSTQTAIQLLRLQRSAGNRATARLMESHRSPPHQYQVDAAITVQRDDPVNMPADSITGSRGAATVAKLREMDSAGVEAELKKMSHDDRIKVATAIYANPVTPGTQTAILMQTFRRVDSEALRIGNLNADYDRSYRDGNWHDIVMYLNVYDEPGIAERVAKWKPTELTEGIFQARQQFGPSGEVRLGGPMLKRLPPPAAAPGKGAQLVALGPDAIRMSALMLKDAAPAKVPGGIAGEVELKPGSKSGKKILVSASATAVYYAEGPSLFVMWAPDFVRDMYLKGFVEGVMSSEGWVKVAKAEMAFIIAFFVPWYGTLALGILETVATIVENQDSIDKIRAAMPKFLAARATFKSKYPTLYDKIFWHCFKEAIVHLPEGVEMADVAYLLGRILGRQGYLGAFEKALAQGAKVTAKTTAKIVAEYVVLVGLIHAPGIASRAAQEAAKKGANDVKKVLAEMGIDASDPEAMLIAKELVAGSPEATMIELSDSARDVAEALAKIEQWTKKNTL
jgi:hypothetical protein